MNARQDGRGYTPLIHNYLRKYQENPSSRVFAPLAEAYRKAGLIKEAIEIAREGLQIHPEFIGGKVALGRALFDQKNYDQVIEVMTPIVRDVPDNLIAQKLIAESNLMLGRIIAALDAYKMLLYFSPTDMELAHLVRELEQKAYEEGALVLEKTPEPRFQVHSATDAIEKDPERKKARWMSNIERLQQMLSNVQAHQGTRKTARP